MATLGGAVIVALGRLVARIQRHRARPLTGDERALLERVFRGTVALDRVRIVPGKAGLFDVNDRPFTLGDTIYLKGRTSPKLLVHECVHVWQYQHVGPRYAYEALMAQRRLGKGAYDWQAELARGKAWAEFNREAQAEFVADKYDAEDADTALAPLRG
jgi:hypothetical protein